MYVYQTSGFTHTNMVSSFPKIMKTQFRKMIYKSKGSLIFS